MESRNQPAQFNLRSSEHPESGGPAQSCALNSNIDIVRPGKDQVWLFWLQAIGGAGLGLTCIFRDLEWGDLGLRLEAVFGVPVSLPARLSRRVGGVPRALVGLLSW